MKSMSNPSASRLVTLLVLAAACSAPAWAAPAAAPAAKGQAITWVGDFDTNHDGKVTPQEATAAPGLAKNFAGFDANHDGAITMSEVKAMWRAGLMQAAQASVQERMATFTKSDTNKDGKLSPDEAKAGGMSFVVANFKAFDANHDGSIDKDEMQKGATALAQQVLAQRPQRMQALFTKADTNKDGKLSQAEFTATFPKFAPQFSFFDENHDGSVGPAEFGLPPGI